MRTLKKNLAGQFSHRTHQVHLSERKMEKTRFGIKTLNGLLKKKERKKPHRLMQNIPKTGSRFSSRSTRQSFDLITHKSKLIKSRQVLKKKSNKIKTSNRPFICKPSLLFSRWQIHSQDRNLERTALSITGPLFPLIVLSYAFVF